MILGVQDLVQRRYNKYLSNFDPNPHRPLREESASHPTLPSLVEGKCPKLVQGSQAT